VGETGTAVVPAVVVSVLGTTVVMVDRVGGKRVEVAGGC